MQTSLAFLVLLLSTTVFAMTPQLSSSMHYKNDMLPSDCKTASCKPTPWDSVCNASNVIFDANDDGSFDIVFLDFKVETDSNHTRSTAQCHLQIPIAVPPGYRLSLKSVALAGITEVSKKGLSEASISHAFYSGRESIQTERFRFQNQLQDVVVNHSIGNDYTTCDKDSQAMIDTKIEIVAQREWQDTENTFIAIDEGAVQRRMNYRLDYQRCDGQPGPKDCGAQAILIAGQCKPFGQRCADYDFSTVKICNNGKDSLQCDWLPETQRCLAKCPETHFAMDGQCFKPARQCSEYNGSSSKVCNNGHDALQCNWNEQNRVCFKE